jgi:hypothetical protein
LLGWVKLFFSAIVCAVVVSSVSNSFWRANAKILSPVVVAQARGSGADLKKKLLSDGQEHDEYSGDRGGAGVIQAKP